MSETIHKIENANQNAMTEEAPKSQHSGERDQFDPANVCAAEESEQRNRLSDAAAKAEASLDTELNELGAKGALDRTLIDLEELRADQDFGQASGELMVTSVPIKRPGNQTFLQLHSDPAWEFKTGMLKYETDGEFYLVKKQMHTVLGTHVKLYCLLPVITRQNELRLWPIKLPDPLTGKLDPWNRSALDAVKAARSGRWMRVESDTAAGCYRTFAAINELDPPAWPDLTFEQILHLAFEERIIGDRDHHIVKALEGKI